MSAPITLGALIERAQAAALGAVSDAMGEATREQELAAVRERILALDLPVTEADEALLARGDLRDDVGVSLPAVRAWLAERPRKAWLWLGGPTGRGKTLAACWALLARGKGRLVGARELERLHMTRFGDEAVRAYEHICRARYLLVLDDLGREDDADKMQRALLDLVDQRRGSGHLTIVTSNMRRESVRKRYPDKRLWSRLDECSLWVDDVGPDMRTRRV